MECPQNCHGNGDCLSGICHCFPGFLGPDCSRGKCTHTKTLCHPRCARNCSEVVIPAVAVTCATRWRFKCPVYSRCTLCLGPCINLESGPFSIVAVVKVLETLFIKFNKIGLKYNFSQHYNFVFNNT